MAKTTEFLLSVRDEAKKVTWPDVPQLRESTGIIIIFMLIVSAVIFVLDTGVAAALQVIRSVLGG